MILTLGWSIVKEERGSWGERDWVGVAAGTDPVAVPVTGTDAVPVGVPVSVPGVPFVAVEAPPVVGVPEGEGLVVPRVVTKHTRIKIGRRGHTE